MDPVTMALIMGGSGLLKSQLVDKPKEDRQRFLASATQRYSPWTGLKAGAIDEADPFGATMQGGVSGLAQGQNMQKADAGMQLQDAQTNYIKGLSATPNNDAGMEGIPMSGKPAANSTMDTRMNPYKLSKTNFNLGQ